MTCFIGNHQRVAKIKDPIRNDYPPDLTAGTNIFFVNTNIIEQQHVAGVKSPLLKINDSEKNSSYGTLEFASTTAHKVFTELELQKVIASAIEEIQKNLVSVTGHKVAFTGTGRMALTLKIREF